jgi:glycosyltransferase involved in cell wall biosynthesis
MRILIIQPNLWLRDGAAPVAVMKAIAAELRDQHDFFFLAICKLEEPIKQDLMKLSCEMEHLGYPRWFPLPISARLWKIVRSWKPNVIHLNQLRSELFAPFLKILFPSIPIITTKHGAHEYLSRGTLTVFTRLLLRVVDRFIDQTVAISKHESEVYARHGINPNKIKVIYNGVEPVVYRRKGREIRRIGTVGKLVERKGHEYFIHMAHKLITDGCERLEFRIYGDGPRKASLQKLIEELNCSGKVKLMGYTSNKEDIYSSIDVYVHTSLQEPFGLSVVEAMQCGIPVVCFAVGALKEIVEEGVTGYLVDPYDVKALINRIRSLVDNPSKASLMGKEGIRRYKEMFTSSLMANEYNRIYTSFQGSATART